MSISIKSDDFKQKMVDYINSMTIVNQYVYSITKQDMQVLTSPPVDYAKFTSSFSTAKATCMTWTNAIFPSILSFPQVTLSSDSLFKMELNVAQNYLKLLQSDPNNNVYKKSLHDSMTNLEKTIQINVDSATALLIRLEYFSKEINQDAKVLNDIAVQSFNDLTSDKNEITELTNDIADLRKKISTWQTELTVAEIGTATSVFTALVGIACCFIPVVGVVVGPTILVIAVGGEVASIVSAIVLDKDIKDAEKKIDADLKKISKDNQDVLALQSINTTFKNLLNANVATQNALKEIISLWTDLQTIISDTKTDLTNVDNDITAEEYSNALNDINTTADSWSDVVAFSNALNSIDYKWQDSTGEWHKYSDETPSADNIKVEILQVS
ncbi:MAG: enterotoxin [Clostridiaceae bacterium]|jgi:hypothetical protein|nr:enterotoxin [Clostridiaceae bacterium]